LKLVALDLRALAWLRVGLALVVLTDLALRLRDLTAFYTDAGVLPRAALLGIAHNTYFGLHLTAGTGWGVALLAGLLALAALALLVGYHTRTAALAVWLLHMSWRHRNPWISDAGDLELGLILFWCLFLPLGARASVDARRTPNSLPNRYASPATLGYLLQLSLIYFMAGFYKLGPIWAGTGQGLYYTFSIDQFATPLARAALGHPVLLERLTYAVVAVELTLAGLLWIPRLRALALALLVGFHLSIAACLQLGMMVPIAIVCSLGWWPWRREPPLGALVRAADARLPRLELPQGQLPGQNALLACACAYVIYINYAVSQPVYRVPLPIQAFGYVTQLFQNWPLFAPEPQTDDGWFVVEGTCRNRQTVDLLRGGLLASWGKPPLVSAQFPNHRWRRWYQNMRTHNDRQVTEAFLRWAGQEWNRRHAGEERLHYVRLVFVAEPTPPPGQPLTWRTEVLGELRL